MIRTVVALIGITKQGLVRVWGLLLEIVKSVAALPSPKRLRAGRPKASPTRPSVPRSMGELFTGIGAIGTATGVDP